MPIITSLRVRVDLYVYDVVRGIAWSSIVVSVLLWRNNRYVDKFFAAGDLFPRLQ
mgnify:CR=1 FL=1